jgi:hypothetical protein
MRTILVAVPALLFAGLAVAQERARPDPLEPRAKAPPVEFRSAFEGYRRYADPELRDWRKSNADVEAARRPASKPAPDKPAPQGHGDHK